MSGNISVMIHLSRLGERPAHLKTKLDLLAVIILFSCVMRRVGSSAVQRIPVSADNGVRTSIRQELATVVKSLILRLLCYGLRGRPTETLKTWANPTPCILQSMAADSFDLTS